MGVSQLNKLGEYPTRMFENKKIALFLEKKEKKNIEGKIKITEAALFCHPVGRIGYAMWKDHIGI